MAAPYTPEQIASFRAYDFGTTLDWASRILVEIDYPTLLNRWFVDAVSGLCQQNKARFEGKAVDLAHSTVAKRGERYKSKTQARDLVTDAIERDLSWSRRTRMMIFDIERPKPHERAGKDKRAKTKYTDFLTPAAVEAQMLEQRIKKADPLAWKSSSYRSEKRAEILTEVVKMLPSVPADVPDAELPPQMQEPRCSVCEAEAKHDGDDSPRYKKDCPGHEPTLEERVKLQEGKGATARRRVIDLLVGGHLTDEVEIDARVQAVAAYYTRQKAELERDCKAALKLLSGMRATRLVMPARFIDPETVAAEVDAKLGTEAGKTGPPDWLDFGDKKGVLEDPLLVETDGPSSSTSSSGKSVFKGVNV